MKIWLEKLRLATIGICLLILFVPASADSSTARQQLDQFLEGLNTYQASFSQLLMDQEQGSESHSYGTFYLAHPNRFMWQYREPDNIYILGDGKSIWLVDEDLEQVTQTSQRRALEGTPIMVLAADVELEQEFKVNELGTHLGLSWLELIPRNEESQFEQILLAFENSDLVKMEMSDKFGQTTRFDFSQRQRNKTLDPMLFVFQPPHGYDILEQDE